MTGFWCDWFAIQLSRQPIQPVVFKVPRELLVPLNPPSTRIRQLTGYRLFNFPSSLADGLIATLLEDDTYIRQYLASYQSRLAESYTRATQFFHAHGIPYQESNASLFLMVNLAAVIQDKPLNDDGILSLLRKKKVYVTSGASSRSEQRGWFRVVIAHPHNVLDEGLKRIVEAFS